MFEVFKRDIADVEPFVRLPKTSGETYTNGEAVKLLVAGVTKCGATDKAEYIVVGTQKEHITCIKVLPTTCFRVGYNAKPTALTKVTLHTDGLSVTATTTSGVFLVAEVDENKETCLGYFC